MKRLDASVCTSACYEKESLPSERQDDLSQQIHPDSTVKIEENYFVFTAGSSGVVRVTQSDLTSRQHKRRWETSSISGAWSDENGNLWIPVIKGYTYQFGIIGRQKTGPYEIAFSYIYQGMIPVTVSIFSVGYNSSSVLKQQHGRTKSAFYDRLSQVHLLAKPNFTEPPTGISPYEDHFLPDLDVLAEARFSRYASGSPTDTVLSGWNEIG